MKFTMPLTTNTPVQPRPLRHKMLPLVGAVMLCCGASLNAEPANRTAASPAIPTAIPTAIPNAVPKAIPKAIPTGSARASNTARVPQPPAAPDVSYSLTFKQLGSTKALNLRGIDGRSSLPFSVRADEVITKATLKFTYTASPDLLADLSKINVIINGEVAASLPLPKETAGTPVSQVVDLPAHLITEYNVLTLQLIGHYVPTCEDPQHSSLWATISNLGVLEFSTESAPVANDLALLPEPFFDIRDGRTLNLPVVFLGTPDNSTLEAAGTISSWFGARARGRVLNFPTSIDTLPAKGNAIVLVGSKSVIPGLRLPGPTGPALAVIANPNDPNGKLLLVQGRNGKDLKLAAAALATATKTLVGQSMAITQPAELSPRKAYDAPNWLRSDRPVKLGELSTASALNVTGYDPGDIAIGLRLPPDLFTTNDKGIPLDLKYRYTPQPTAVNSSLIVKANNNFVKSYPLLPMERLTGAPLLAKLQADESLPMQATTRIPLAMLQSRSKIDLRYMYDYTKQGECRDVIVDNVRGAIDPESTLDISGYSHSLAMPNLAAYGGSGYPFTRMADLSQTAVVLPDAPHIQELSTYLNLLGRLGESTGYPGTAITVGRSAQVAELADKDLLVIATGVDQPLIKNWAASLPSALEDNRRTGLRDQFSSLVGWVTARLPEILKPAVAAATGTAVLPPFSSTGLSAYVAGFESPLRSGRSVVLFWGSEPTVLQTGVVAFLGAEGEAPQIAGGLTILRGQKVDTVAVEPTYSISDLDWFTRTRLALSGNVGLLLLFCALGVFLVARLGQAMLRAQVRKRGGA